MKVTSKGQVTIPQEFRERFGLLPHTEVEFRPIAGGVKLMPAKKPSQRGISLVDRLRGKGNRKLTTDQIMALTRGEAP